MAFQVEETGRCSGAESSPKPGAPICLQKTVYHIAKHSNPSKGSFQAMRNVSAKYSQQRARSCIAAVIRCQSRTLCLLCPLPNSPASISQPQRPQKPHFQHLCAECRCTPYPLCKQRDGCAARTDAFRRAGRPMSNRASLRRRSPPHHNTLYQVSTWGYMLLCLAFRLAVRVVAARAVCGGEARRMLLGAVPGPGTPAPRSLRV